MRVCDVRASSPPLGYLCAKFCLFCGLHCWNRQRKKLCTQSLSLFDATGTEAFASEKHNVLGIYLRTSQIIFNCILPWYFAHSHLTAATFHPIICQRHSRSPTRCCYWHTRFCPACCWRTWWTISNYCSRWMWWRTLKISWTEWQMKRCWYVAMKLGAFWKQFGAGSIHGYGMFSGMWTYSRQETEEIHPAKTATKKSSITHRHVQDTEDRSIRYKICCRH